MAAPLFTFHSLFQSGVTVNPTGGFATWEGQSGSNGYDNGCPGFEVWGTSNVNIDIASNAEAGVTFYANSTWSTVDLPIILISGPTTDLVRLASVNTVSGDSPQKFQYWNGSSWIQAGTNIETSEWVAKRIDITWKLHASTGFFRIYVAGALRAEFTGNTLFTADTGITKMSFRNPQNNAGYSTSFWHIMVDNNEDVRKLWMAVDEPISNGFWTEWAGSSTDVDDYPFEINGQLTFVTVSAAGLKETFNLGTVNTSLTATGIIETVIVGIWGRALSEPGFHAKPILRKSSTDYTPAGSFQMVSNKDAFYGIQINNDPSTGAAWANAAAVEAHQVGFESSLTPA